MSSEMGNMAAHSLMKGIRDANPNTRCILIAHGIEHNGADRDESYEVLQLPVRRKQLLSIVLGRQEIFKSPSQEMGSHQLHAVGSEEILLVEDNTMNQKVAIYQLNAMGYGAEIAGNGEEALKKLTKRRYGLILMDCQMPVLDGYETTRQIRKLEKSNEHIPIVAMTANAMTGDRALCLEAGMDDYLTKPLLRVQLAAVLEKYLPREKNPPTLHLIDNDRLQELFGDNETLKLEMLKMFIEHTGPLVEELNRACDIGEIPMVEVQAMGHRLAGSCLNLGADALGHLGRQIEDAARQANAGELRKLAKECLLTFDDMRHRISTSPKEHT
jgi:CheY-like chemotaxis protein/HPt (histidine-containing phosphotransfer) domain-containing protein